MEIEIGKSCGGVVKDRLNDRLWVEISDKYFFKNSYEFLDGFFGWHYESIYEKFGKLEVAAIWK
jgi:hypothetical protein